MTATLAALFVLVGGAAGSAVWGRTPKYGPGPWTAVIGAALAAVAGLQVLLTGVAVEITAYWPMPLGSLHIGLDALSAVFVLLISVVAALAAIYGRGYLGADIGDGKIALSWCWYNLLVAAMLLVVIARDGLLFLMAWEAMSLTSFFLVMFDHEKKEVLQAGWLYLVATHAGTAFLLAMFLLLGHGDNLDFGSLAATGWPASAIFAAALIGFGTKAGFAPLHVWLPEAHPAAPSHVSALMSGVMIKTGIYGLLRVLTFLGEPPLWWGWALIAIGAVSGILGVLFALAQHDLKRLLAYHSVENIGIIALGLGIGVLGISEGNSAMAILGLCGGLLHVLNHGLFKSLLFMGAGSVLHAGVSREIDRMGGLLKRMPVTGAAFLIGSMAICALPPLNGFVSEFLVYSAAYTGISAGDQLWAGVMTVGSLALIGGLAAACFSKAFGIVFLGEARDGKAAEACDAPRFMRWPMIVLALLCIVIGLAGSWTVRLILPAVVQLAPPAADPAVLGKVSGLLARMGWGALMLLGLTGIIIWLRSRLLCRCPRREAATWDCGYAAPSARMQYTASSYAQPIVAMFRPVLRTQSAIDPPKGLFPDGARLHTHTPDLFIHGAFGPALQLCTRLAAGFRRVQQGRTHLYILYIVITIVLLLLWNLR